MLSRRTFCMALAALHGLALRGSAAEPAAVRFSERVTIHFAAPELGRELIAREDDFTRALSPFDLQSRLQTDRPVTRQDLLDLYRKHVTEWPAEEAAAVADAWAFVADRLAGFRLGLPESIYLVRTTGKEESGAAYCRGAAIVLPANMLRQKPEGLRRLLAHELFHVLSTHDAELRRDAYALIGFTLCEPIPPPAALAARTIANPDAPRIDCTMEVTLEDGARVTAAPLLLASAEKFDPAAGKSMFDYLQFRLLVVEKQSGAWRAVEQDGEPRLIDPAKNASFWKQIGRNTTYIIHPDEILAENFAHLVMQTDKLPTPEIVARLKERLAK